MNKLIMNYLVTEGFKEAAEKFQQESGITPSLDLNTMENRIMIRDAIQNGRIQEATALQLHLLELIRENKIEEALHFAQEQLSESGQSDPDILNELERTMALLAFGEPMNSPFGDLLNQAHRQKVASQLNTAILKMEHHESTSPRLLNLLKIILWSQGELDKKKIEYPKMVDFSSARLDSAYTEPK
ncbi:hypothetical protein M8J76_015134 [Diaphorina citri]|nr:hypothetical protein M8J76_015134 [Diaphorina citri]